MERYSFFNAEQDSAGNFDRVYLAEDIASYFASFVDNGVYSNAASNLQVVATDGFNIKVKPGKGWIKGYYYENDSDIPFTLSLPDGLQSRIDSVVMRLDMINRYIRVFVKEGVFSGEPLAPVLTRTADVWELQLATIRVDAASIDVKQENITDTRADKEKCGYVKGVIEQIDTTNLFAQYDNAFKNWFESIKGMLAEDAATNLAQQLEEAKAAITVANQKITQLTADYEAYKSKQADIDQIQGGVINELKDYNTVYTANVRTDGWVKSGNLYYQDVPCTGMKRTYNLMPPWFYKTGNVEADKAQQDTLDLLRDGVISPRADQDGYIRVHLYNNDQLKMKSGIILQLRRA